MVVYYCIPDELTFLLYVISYSQDKARPTAGISGGPRAFFLCLQIENMSSILPRIGLASQLGYLYNDIKVPLVLNGSGGIFVMVYLDCQ